MPDTMRLAVRLATISPVILAATTSLSCSRDTSAAAPPTGAARAEAPASAPKSAGTTMPDPCSLATTEEVGAVLKRKMVSSSSGSTCDYANAPESTPPPGTAQMGSMDDLVKSLSSSTPTVPQMPQAVATLTDVKIGLARDGMTEAQIKAIYARTGRTVRHALDPEQKGLHDALVVANDIPNVGDWAFTTNVAAVNMGFGFSSRGRILEARKGPWHLTVGATISPDPGEAALDAELADIARTAIARLP